MAQYIVRRRVRPDIFPSYERPWELCSDGLPIGFYLNLEDAVAASPEPPYIIRERQ